MKDISIIVPIYNEEKVISENSASLKKLAGCGELIFVDAASSDKGPQIAASLGKVLSCIKGRAPQMNRGAKEAISDILLFLHADTTISPGTLEKIIEKIKAGPFIGGCLTQRIDKLGIMYRLIEGFGNIRARLTRVFYGDQGIFVRKDVFLNMGGFPEVPVMEDVLFTKKLRKLGKAIVLPDKILASPRRWESRGIIRTALLYSFITILFWLKVPLDKIKSLYGDLR